MLDEKQDSVLKRIIKEASGLNDPLDQLKHPEPDDTAHAHEPWSHLEVEELDDTSIEQEPVVREVSEELACLSQPKFFETY